MIQALSPIRRHIVVPATPDRAFTQLGFQRGHSWIVFVGPLP